MKTTIREYITMLKGCEQDFREFAGEDKPQDPYWVGSADLCRNLYEMMEEDLKKEGEDD